MMSAATRHLIDAATAAIKADAGVGAAFAGKAVRMLQIVPEFGPTKPADYPYVTFGGAEKKREPVNSCVEARALITLHVHVWDADKTITRISNIAESIEAPLLALVLDAGTGLRILTRTHVVTRCHYDQDRSLLFGVCQIEFRVAEIG